MSWIKPRNLYRKPLVIVEDSLKDLTKLLATFSKTDPEIMGNLTAVCVAPEGTDTSESVKGWIATYPRLQVAACVQTESASEGSRVLNIQRFVSQDLELSRVLTELLMPGGVLLQDIHLDSLPFFRSDNPWAACFALANHCRGFCREKKDLNYAFMSKMEFPAGFTAQVVLRKFDATWVFNKLDGTRMLRCIPDHIREEFPWWLRFRGYDRKSPLAISRKKSTEAAVSREFDFVLWPRSSSLYELMGRGVNLERTSALQARTQLFKALKMLVDDSLIDGPGVSAQELFALHSNPPEQPTVEYCKGFAARLIGNVKGRLKDGDRIDNVGSATYKFDERFEVAEVHER